jgi:hypothetical protein
MSNTGPDLIGAWNACSAARRDIREAHLDSVAAKEHFEQMHKEFQKAEKSETLGDVVRHTWQAVEEESKGKSAMQSSDKHFKDGSEHLKEYNAKWGRDHPTKEGSDGPDCTPVGKAMLKEQEDANKRL